MAAMSTRIPIMSIDRVRQEDIGCFIGRLWLKWHAHTYIQLTYDNTTGKTRRWQLHIFEVIFPVGMLEHHRNAVRGCLKEHSD